MSGLTTYYNGVILRDCEYKQFSSLFEYDQDNATRMRVKHRITVEGTVSATAMGTIDRDEDDPDNPPDNLYIDEFNHPSVAVKKGDTVKYEEGFSPRITPATMPEQLRNIIGNLSIPRRDFWIAVDAAFDDNINQIKDDVTASVDPYSVDPKKRPGPNNKRLTIIIAAAGHPKHAGSSPPSDNPAADPNVANTSNTWRDDVLDCDNGPKPIRADIVRIMGARMVRVQFSIDVCLQHGDWGDRDYNTSVSEGNEKDKAFRAKGVISNTWSVKDSVDDKWLTTHDIQGKLTVAHPMFKPHAMRLLAQCPFHFAFARCVHQEYAVDASGLTLAYHHVLRETGSAPPIGVVDWEAKYTEKTTMNGSGHMMGLLSARVTGRNPRSGFAIPETEQLLKDRLLNALWIIARSRLTGINRAWNPLPGNIAETTIVESCSVIETVGKPEMALELSVRHTDTGEQLDNFGMRLQNMGAPLYSKQQLPEWDPKWWPPMPIFAWDTHGWELGGHAKGYFEPRIRDVYGDGEFDNVGLRMYPFIDADLTFAVDAYASNISNNLSLGPMAGEGRDHGYAVQQANNTYEQNYQSFGGGNFPGKPGLNMPSPGSPLGGRFGDGTDGGYFNTYVTTDLQGNLTLGDVPRVVGDQTKTGVANTQLTGVENLQVPGYSYLHWESENCHDVNPGMVYLPLSKSRPHPLGVGTQTAVAVRLHAGCHTREFKIVARRNGAWPKVPVPKQIILDVDDPSGHVEELIDAQLIPETPTLGPDGVTLVYTVHAKWTYGLSRKLDIGKELNPNISLSSQSEVINVGSSQMNKTTTDDSRLPILAIMDYSDAIYKTRSLPG
jgi:hypothetical protein